MIEVINYKEIPSFTRIPVETICRCDNCKRIIARKKDERNPNDDNISLKEYQESHRKYVKDNPITITFYKVNKSTCPNDYCEDCLMEGIKYVLGFYDEITVEKIQDNCFYTEVGDKNERIRTGEEK